MKARVLKQLYPRVRRGLPTLGTPEETLARYTERTESEDILDLDALVRRYTYLSGATGFVTGLPGWLLLPVVLPANVIGNAAIQLHLTMVIALAAGCDLDDPVVRHRCTNCLLGNWTDEGQSDETEEAAKRTGLKIGERVVRYAASRLVRSAAHRSARLFGLRRVPLLGGFMSAGSDIALTRHVAHCAQERFLGLPAE